jgi:hypothetical protein
MRAHFPQAGARADRSSPALRGKSDGLNQLLRTRRKAPEHTMTLLEIIGAFALFFIIVLAIGTTAGWFKWSATIVKD